MATWPAAARINNWRITVEASSRGATGRGGGEQFERTAGARWLASFEVPAMLPADALAFRAFAHGRRGFGSFDMAVPGAVYATATATALLNGATSADADTVVVDTVSDAARLIAGEWLYVGAAGSGQLVQIVSVTGGTTCVVRPRLRAAYADNTAVAIGGVTAQWRFAKTPVVPLIPGRSRPFQVELEEAY